MGEKKRKLTRRRFLGMSAVAAAGAVAASCGGGESEVVKETVVQTVVEKETVVETVVAKETVVEEKVVEVTVEPAGTEPPFLADRVASGELPPVDERLPVSPAVVGGRDAIGDYGGEIRMIHLTPTDFTENYDLNSERMLHYSDLDLRTIVPNIFESWEVSNDGKTYTLHMREGMKWSDGEPLTTEDVRFWWEDVQLNTDLTSSPAWQFRFGGPNMEVEIIDDYTVSFTFATTFGNFPAHLTRWEVPWQIIIPAHFYKQFHASYTDQAELEAMAADEGLEGWPALFNSRWGWGIGVWSGPDYVANGGYPVVGPWWIVERPAEGLYLWERNPYYWKVDLAGNQLPYIDTMRYDYVDLVGQHSVTMAEYPLYKENEDRSNYTVGDYLSCMSDRYILFPQHYLAEDEVLTEIVNHPNFVKALSVAIDRDEVNESLFFGTARMGQASVMPMSKYYKEQYGTAWAQYDPDLANQLLDEMGLDQRDSDGFRLRPDGERLTFNIEHAGERVGPVTDKYTEIVVTQWRDVGIDASTKQIQESLYNERMLAYQVHCGVWHNDRCTDLLFPIEPRWFIPTTGGNQGTACAAWAAWYQAADRTAEDLIQPPDEIKALYDIFDQMTSVVDEDERVALGQQIFDYLIENPLEIGVILECPAPVLYNKNMRNMPRPKVPIGWDTYGFSTYHPEAFYYEGGERF
jgi:peptide/nickel transport system substrate-binding protein